MLLATVASVVALTSGISGKALIDPAFPVCRVDKPCTAPDPRDLVVFWRGPNRAATTTTATDGTFRVALPPGVYTVTLPRRKGLRVTVAPTQLRVTRGRFLRAVLLVDIGIR